MKINEIILNVMDNTTTMDGKKYTQVLMAEEITKAQVKTVTAAAVNDRLKNENMKMSSVIEMLDVLGYEVIVKPKNANDKRDSYVVEPGYDRKRVK
jgi:hypothetical protein